MRSRLRLTTKKILLVCVLIGWGIATGRHVLLQAGYLIPWTHLPSLTRSGESIVQAYYDSIFVQDTRGQVYLWYRLYSRFERNQWQEIPDVSVVVDYQGTMAIGARPCDMQAPAFKSWTRPSGPYRDCVTNVQGHGDGSTTFVYVIDDAGEVWRMTETITAYDIPAWLGILVGGGLIGLVFGVIGVLIKEIRWIRGTLVKPKS